MFYKYALSSIFLERDIKAMQKEKEWDTWMSQSIEKRETQWRSPEYKKEERWWAHEGLWKDKIAMSQIQKLEKEILSNRGV